MATALAFDTSVLSTFARAGRLELLERLTGGRRRVVTRAVLGELERGRGKHPALADALSLRWLETASIEDLDDLIVFNQYVRVLGVDSKNIGESSILAWAERIAGVALVDDDAAVTAGRARRVPVRRSLGLVHHGVHSGELDRAQARALVDDLIQLGGSWFTCDGAGFEAWAEARGLLPLP